MFKTLLVFFSFSATLLSLVFMLAPELFRRIEEFLGLEFGSSSGFATALEGSINFINDWLYENRILAGPAMAVVAAWNTRNAFFF